MTGKIIKGIAGFYYVHIEESGVYQCKAKGIFRKNQMKPLVGDHVEIQVTDEKDMEGNIEKILPRKNQLVRPAVANIDQALVIFAATQPDPNLNLLDRFLVMMLKQQVPTVICFNKQDIAQEDQLEELRTVYAGSGCRLIFTSAHTQEGLEEIGNILRGRTTAVAGPSGVGKSSLINCLQKGVSMEVGDISAKIKRGKHTTRHSELIYIEDQTYIMDTPGFSTLYIDDFEKEELRTYFTEFDEYENTCRFSGCLHMEEPGCEVKKAVEINEISKQRYESYRILFEELKDKRRY